MEKISAFKIIFCLEARERRWSVQGIQGIQGMVPSLRFLCCKRLQRNPHLRRKSSSVPTAWVSGACLSLGRSRPIMNVASCECLQVRLDASKLGPAAEPGRQPECRTARVPFQQQRRASCFAETTSTSRSHGLGHLRPGLHAFALAPGGDRPPSHGMAQEAWLPGRRSSVQSTVPI
jgi:hypothetical protein